MWDSYNGSDIFANPKHWCRKINYFDSHNKHFILAWVTASTSKILADLPKSEIGANITQLFRKLLNDESIPEPDDVLVTEWAKNENFLGTYSFTEIGGTTETRKKISDPIYVNDVPRVLFAGEATHLSRFSTVDGAYSSGIREAERIIELEKSELTKCSYTLSFLLATFIFALIFSVFIFLNLTSLIFNLPTVSLIS